MGICFDSSCSGAPNALLDVGSRDDHGLIVGMRGVKIESGRGLRAEVSVFYVEVESANGELATDAGELHSSFDPAGGVVSHEFNCRP